MSAGPADDVPVVPAADKLGGAGESVYLPLCDGDTDGQCFTAILMPVVRLICADPDVIAAASIVGRNYLGGDLENTYPGHLWHLHGRYRVAGQAGRSPGQWF